MNKKPLMTEAVVKSGNIIASHHITKPLVLILVKLKEIRCCVNRQTQPNRSNIPVLYSVLLHVSAVYISHHHLGISSQKNEKGRGLS
jgi:hypothetical protein